MMMILRRLGVLSCVFSCLFTSNNSFAIDALQILPTRLVLDKNRSGEFNLINKGTAAGRYRILVRNMRTDDNGAFSAVDVPYEDELFAEKFIRYSPRRVSIEPGEYQKVRLTARKPKGLTDGEYRSHLVFQTLPKPAVSPLQEDQDMQISVDPIVEVIIPIIVRHGKLEATSQITDPKVEAGQLSFSLHRTGTRSLYGDATVTVLEGPHKGEQVGYVRGLSVYYPNKVRNIRFALNAPDDIDLRNTKMRVEFKEDPSYGGDITVSADYP